MVVNYLRLRETIVLKCTYYKDTTKRDVIFTVTSDTGGGEIEILVLVQISIKEIRLADVEAALKKPVMPI